MGPIWGRQDQGGPHVGPMNFAVWVYLLDTFDKGVLEWRFSGTVHNREPIV